MLQQHKLLKVIKKKLVRKALDMFKKMNEETYKKFWEQFSTNVKLGVIEDASNKSRLAKLLRCGCGWMCVKLKVCGCGWMCVKLKVCGCGWMCVWDCVKLEVCGCGCVFGIV